MEILTQQPQRKTCWTWLCMSSKVWACGPGNYSRTLSLFEDWPRREAFCYSSYRDTVDPNLGRGERMNFEEHNVSVFLLSYVKTIIMENLSIQFWCCIFIVELPLIFGKWQGWILKNSLSRFLLFPLQIEERVWKTYLSSYGAVSW